MKGFKYKKAVDARPLREKSREGVLRIATFSMH